MPAPLSAAVRKQLVVELALTMRQVDVAARLGISQGTVSTTLKRERARGAKVKRRAARLLHRPALVAAPVLGKKPVRILVSCPVCGMVASSRRFMGILPVWRPRFRFATVTSRGPGLIQNHLRD